MRTLGPETVEGQYNTLQGRPCHTAADRRKVILTTTAEVPMTAGWTGTGLAALVPAQLRAGEVSLEPDALSPAATAL